MATFKAKTGVIDVSKIKGAMRREVRDAVNAWFAEGIIVFLETALPLIPVDTGMSRASLKPLAVKVDYEYTIVPKREQVAGSYTLTGGYRPGKIRDIQAGIVAGKKAIKYKPATLTNFETNLTYKIQVYQWDIKEEYWGALDAASSAMRVWLKSNRKKLEEQVGKITYRTLGTIFK